MRSGLFGGGPARRPCLLSHCRATRNALRARGAKLSLPLENPPLMAALPRFSRAPPVLPHSCAVFDLQSPSFALLGALLTCLPLEVAVSYFSAPPHWRQTLRVRPSPSFPINMPLDSIQHETVTLLAFAFAAVTTAPPSLLILPDFCVIYISASPPFVSIIYTAPFSRQHFSHPGRLSPQPRLRWQLGPAVCHSPCGRWAARAPAVYLAACIASAVLTSWPDAVAG